MNYLPSPTTDVDNPTPVLREIHRLARGYSRVFAQARFAERLSRPNPVRRVGFDMRLDVVESVEAVDGVRCDLDDRGRGTASRAPARPQVDLQRWRSKSRIPGAQGKGRPGFPEAACSCGAGEL